MKISVAVVSLFLVGTHAQYDKDISVEYYDKEHDYDSKGSKTHSPSYRDDSKSSKSKGHYDNSKCVNPRFVSPYVGLWEAVSLGHDEGDGYGYNDKGHGPQYGKRGGHERGYGFEKGHGGYDKGYGGKFGGYVGSYDNGYDGYDGYGKGFGDYDHGNGFGFDKGFGGGFDKGYVGYGSDQGFGNYEGFDGYGGYDGYDGFGDYDNGYGGGYDNGYGGGYDNGYGGGFDKGYDGGFDNGYGGGFDKGYDGGFDRYGGKGYGGGYGVDVYDGGNGYGHGGHGKNEYGSYGRKEHVEKEKNYGSLTVSCKNTHKDNFFSCWATSTNLAQGHKQHEYNDEELLCKWGESRGGRGYGTSDPKAKCMSLQSDDRITIKAVKVEKCKMVVAEFEEITDLDYGKSEKRVAIIHKAPAY